MCLNFCRWDQRKGESKSLCQRETEWDVSVKNTDTHRVRSLGIHPVRTAGPNACAEREPTRISRASLARCCRCRETHVRPSAWAITANLWLRRRYVYILLYDMFFLFFSFSFPFSFLFFLFYFFLSLFYGTCILLCGMFFSFLFFSFFLLFIIFYIFYFLWCSLFYFSPFFWYFPFYFFNYVSFNLCFIY